MPAGKVTGSESPKVLKITHVIREMHNKVPTLVQVRRPKFGKCVMFVLPQEVCKIVLITPTRAGDIGPQQK